MSDVLVIGAGIAGLACAQALSAAGKAVVVLDRARGVGGRCATRRLDGQPVDHGAAFLHGSSPSFLQALRAVPSDRLEGWPSLIEGTGTPCQPLSFAPGSDRLAFPDGLSAFPKSLATGLDIRLETAVTGLEVSEGAISVHTDNESRKFSARDVVLALAGPQAATLIRGLAPSKERDSTLTLLSMMPSVSCLTVIAEYDLNRAPPWHICYPEKSAALQLVSHDSSKRAHPTRTILVLQARPAWSAAHLGTDPQEWSRLLLEDAGRALGDWTAHPNSHHAHQWKYARTGAESTLAAPLVLSVGRGCRLGLAGEVFAPSGGVEAAWQSGEQLARRFLDEVTA